MLARSQFNYSMSHNMFGQNFFFDLPSELKIPIRKMAKQFSINDIADCEDKELVYRKSVEIAGQIWEDACDLLREQRRTNRQLRDHHAFTEMHWNMMDLEV